jgi:hypothetical protein
VDLACFVRIVGFGVGRGEKEKRSKSAGFSASGTPLGSGREVKRAKVVLLWGRRCGLHD